MRGRSVAQQLGGRLSPSGPVSSRWLTVAAVALGAILAWALFTMTWTEWREFRMPDGSGYDLATLNQGFYLALHGHGGLRTTVTGERYHGFVLPVALNHFSPNFYLFLPFYAGWQSSLLLLLLASIAVAATGVALLFAARRVFGSAAIALVWFGLFALHPPIPWSVPTNGFHEVFVAMGFLSFALLYYLKGQDRLFALMLVLAVLSKEDIPLLLPVWGMVAWFHGKGWRLAVCLALLGVAYFLLANAIVLPLIRGHHVGHMYFNAWGSPLGETPKDILHSISSAPGEIPRMALGQQNLRFWAAVFSPLLFLPLLGWDYLVIPAYVYAEIALSGRFQVIPSYHVLPAIPFIFVAAMVGTSRLVNFIARIPPLRPVRSATVRNLSLAALLCGVLGSTVHSTPFLDVVRGNWPTEAGLRQDAPLFQALARIPPQASLAATDTLVAESPSRDELYAFNPNCCPNPFNPRAMAAHEPDYLAIDANDLNYVYLSEARAWIASRLCRGTYGVVYADHHESRMLLERGASLVANPGVYAALVPGSRHECPAPTQEAMSPEIFTRAASFHVRSRFPSEIQPNDTFMEPVIAVSDTRFAQVIHLPDHTFEPGWYQLDLIGAWPWLWAPASFQMTARILVGERTVGQVAAGGDQPLHYTTPPFRIDRRATLPLRVRVELQTPVGQTGTVGALRATREACAVVADAPSLNPQRITVAAWVYPEGLVQRPGTEAEAPILSKGKALGYYLRLSGDAQGKVWVDFSVAGKWAAGRAGTVPFRQWTHIAATYDGQEVRVYIDGRRAPQEPSRSPKHTGRLQSQGMLLAIGCRDPGTPDAEAFPGLIESAGVWNRVLTPQEIQEDAVGSSSPTLGLAGLVGSWDFRELRGGIVPDLSAAGNPITNGAGLTRVPAPEIKQPFAAWRARELNVLRMVTVRVVTP